MAVTKTLIEAIPSNKDGKVEVWELTMKYEEGSDATYYTSNMNVSIPAIKPSDGAVNFIPKAEALWTLAELTALCPTDKWDNIFASQYDSVITNPPNKPVPDYDYVIPS
jgi:hypothetical protein